MTCLTRQKDYILPRLVMVMHMADESSKAVVRPLSSSIWARHMSISFTWPKTVISPEVELPVYMLSKAHSSALSSLAHCLSALQTSNIQ